MEEKVKVTYQGKLLEALKVGERYALRTPSRGNIYGAISNSEDGWVLMEKDSEHPDYYFWIKLRDDGKMEYKNDMMRNSKVSDDVYNPEFSDMGTINEPTRYLYHTAKQLEGHQKLGVSPVDVLELRYRMMGMALKMLGYQSVEQILNGEPNPDLSVMDLNRAVQFIEQYPALAQYVTKGGNFKEPTVEVHLPEDMDKEEFTEKFESIKKSLEEEEAYYNSRNEFFTDVRHPMIGPDFCIGMKNDINPKDWNSYSGIVKKLGKAILSFNSDLLAAGEKMRIVQGASLNQLDMEHQIFLITQGPEMDEALAIESYYFMDQTQKLDERIQADLGDDRTRNSTPGKVMKQFVDELKVEVSDREKAIQRRDYYRNVYPYDKSRKKPDTKKKDEEEPVFGD